MTSNWFMSAGYCRTYRGFKTIKKQELSSAVENGRDNHPDHKEDPTDWYLNLDPRRFIWIQ